jgi:hypothetical protein
LLLTESSLHRLLEASLLVLETSGKLVLLSWETSHLCRQQSRVRLHGLWLLNRGWGRLSSEVWSIGPLRSRLWSIIHDVEIDYIHHARHLILYVIG